jgi:hypothetical protein
MAEKLNEQSISSIQNSHTTKKRLFWTNALSLVSTIAHYFIMIKYDRLAWILQMREPNPNSPNAPFPASTLSQASTLHESSSSLIATW